MAVATPVDPGQPSAEVLGRLLVIAQTIDAIPDETRIADFVRRSLGALPGVADVYLHLESHTSAPNPRMAARLERCKRELHAAPARNALRSVDARAHCFVIETPDQRFGWLVIEIDDEAALRPYLPFLSNIANTVSRIIASRNYQARLAELNEELREARDNLELRVAERTRELEFRATHDPLTGLANRALLIDHLRAALGHAHRSGRMVVVVYLDLDSFTFMNTGLGNACGDEFLRETARRLGALVRDSDTVARIGSDEFVIVFGGLDTIERSSARLSAMQAAVREPVRLDGKEVVVTCSIGACAYPLDGDDPEILVRRANSAMHRAKRSGKDSIQFYAATRDAAVGERMALESELRRAIPAGQLVVHYQPKFDLATQAWRGAEALVRWAHPSRGLLPPDRFIPLAEDSSLIVALGEQVLAQACLQSRLWHDQGLHAKSVAVNLAARQFREDHLVDTVKAVLRDTGLPPSCLELEITESSIMHDLDHAAQLLGELKGLGVSISIDDFGTGYSSLSALRNFPADKLKIDRSFVHEVESVPSAAAVALAVMSFARTLGMRVNAEGVETAGQARFLEAHGCDEIQGFLLARPLPPEQLVDLYRQPRPASWSVAAD